MHSIEFCYFDQLYFVYFYFLDQMKCWFDRRNSNLNPQILQQDFQVAFEAWSSCRLIIESDKEVQTTAAKIKYHYFQLNSIFTVIPDNSIMIQKLMPNEDDT